jgi:hypothetical protein
MPLQLSSDSMKRLLRLACVAISFVLLRCSLSDIPQPPKGVTEPIPTVATPVLGSPARVELDVFSGRPNPTWTLTAAETKTFRDMVAALPGTGTLTFPDPLGYRGMLVSLPAEEANGSVTTWRIWRGVVQQTSDATSTFYVDSDRALEMWLLQSGQIHIEPDLFKTIQAEIGSPNP